MKSTRSGGRLRTALFLGVLAAASASAGQTYYRWLDPQGNPVNSDRPPPTGTPYETVIIDAGTTVTAPSPGNQAAPTARPAQEEQAGQDGNMLPRMEVVKNPEACEAAKQNLETLNTRARIRIPDGQGSYRFIDEEEKAIEREKAQATIKHHCE